MREPVTSPGMRSGVNWMRLVSTSSAVASDRTRRVLATPGTPSSRTCPPASRAMTRPVTAASWPTTALPTSLRTATNRLRGSAPASGLGMLWAPGASPAPVGRIAGEGR